MKSARTSEHLNEASSLTSGLAGKIGLSFLGAIHDLGKFSAAFRNYFWSAVNQSNVDPSDDERIGPEWTKGEIDHSSAGAKLLWQACDNSGSFAIRIAGQMMTLCLASHHSGLIDCLFPNGEDVFSKRMARVVKPTAFSYEEQRVRKQMNELLTSPPIERELTSRLGMLEVGHQKRRGCLCLASLRGSSSAT